MDFAQWGPIADGLDLDLLPDTVGYFWSPAVDARGVLGDAEYPIEDVSEDHKSTDDLLITHSSIMLNPHLVLRLHLTLVVLSPLTVKNTIPHRSMMI